MTKSEELVLRLESRISRLEERNADLLDALESLLRYCSGTNGYVSAKDMYARSNAIAAIAKAKGERP